MEPCAEGDPNGTPPSAFVDATAFDSTRGRRRRRCSWGENLGPSGGSTPVGRPNLQAETMEIDYDLMIMQIGAALGEGDEATEEPIEEPIEEPTEEPTEEPVEEPSAEAMPTLSEDTLLNPPRRRRGRRTSVDSAMPTVARDFPPRDVAPARMRPNNRETVGSLTPQDPLDRAFEAQNRTQDPLDASFEAQFDAQQQHRALAAEAMRLHEQAKQAQAQPDDDTMVAPPVRRKRGRPASQEKTRPSDVSRLGDADCGGTGLRCPRLQEGDLT
eukprot:TRINITY_DN6855_c0_g1_i3.p1 TRINITY_DN6855_c0_g1~~TRINITY_DN6855_c0_g1_i3.p1  ORF type:complete len:271 (-),score=50.19 TRINITY_DN6855_c0_g1_i3:395-1207(-)